MSKQVALVVGASGIIGNAVVETLVSAAQWQVRALRTTAVSNVATIDCDLTDPAGVALALQAASDTTHVFYAAYRPEANAYREAAVNTAMLQAVLQGLQAVGAPLERVVHFQGAKVYGPHLGLAVAPFYEDDPRHLAPNFYYDQEDLLRKYAKRGDFDWSILRPDAVIGEIGGNDNRSVVMDKLAGKTAVITGGSSGIGLATAKRFILEGATVFITGRNQERLAAAVNNIGGDIHAVQGDVGNLDDLDRLYDAIRLTGRGIDIVFANAGVAIPGQLGSISEKDFDTVIGVNMRGTLFTVQKALPLFNAHGAIVLTGSIAGVKGRAGRSVYAASKAALRSFARTWATDLKDRHIRVNLITPGPTETGNLTNASAEVRSVLTFPIVRGRLGEPDEIASAVLFLASDDAAFVNATELFVDGGYAQI